MTGNEPDLRRLVSSVRPVLAAYRSTTGHVTNEQVTEAWAAYDLARAHLSWTDSPYGAVEADYDKP